MQPLLAIKGLSVSVEDISVISNLSLTIEHGKIHAIMGPNGSGKSTLVNTLMGHPAYKITGGSVSFMEEDLLALEPHERARKGIFLALQYPREISGVSLRSFLFSSYNAQMAARNPKKKNVSPIQFKKFLEGKMKQLGMDSVFAERSLNQGFSGGEKKKAEVLQMITLSPILALLDETDSGLDIDALKAVAEGVNSMRSAEFSALVVTHYVRILDYITPDYVHVMVGGEIVESGDAALAAQLEKDGYAKYGIAESS